ncbi:MAG: 4-hydroxybenzoate octaprenyltransferase [Rhodospirillaceae bacterium]|jgi:4-hydroxybenzoate polyprenyltransferase|nr:4-hydroxybenzoate octaprenyltransferase [Rhodospirillaceae bacterium]MBT4589855.1 4-hydroxybenzoate octaprenyltransferase [Rhodospirillaceae bacterium]MBT5939155.1 4-hydroxybenzoate octaprenyltransferase [Rhodospirillaceae bacterium]MBT7267438.1 4-hydroxybenzoate octaprenyltransferase [Rhodospirillaceae bacterium]
MTDTTASDIPRGNWVDRWLPEAARPYARLARFDRPIGTWLLLFPCWWSLALAIENWSDIKGVLWLFILFGLGAKIMRGAGCCMNDIADRDFDGSVARTKDRPIPSGLISVKQAVIFMGFLSALGLTILLQFNWFAVALGAASLILVAIYPFTKRFTFWPQFVLGLTFNWGALLGWAVVRGDIQLPAIILYIAGIFWTLGYDTIYALQDKEDDALIGIKSTALALSGNVKLWLYLFYTATVILMGVSGWLIALSWPFYIGLALTTMHGVWQVWDLKIDNPHDCLAKFKSNRLFSWLFLGGIVLGQIV